MNLSLNMNAKSLTNLASIVYNVFSVSVFCSTISPVVANLYLDGASNLTSKLLVSL